MFTCLCLINIFLRFQFHTRISPNIIQLLIETNIQESIGFIETYLFNLFSIIYFIGVGALMFLVTYLERKNGEIGAFPPSLGRRNPPIQS